MERKAVGIPAGEADTGLAAYRRQIDAIDDRILAILAERFAVIREVAAYKEPRGIPAVIPDRVVEVRERCAARAQAHGLEPDFVRALYDRLIEEACRMEVRLMAARKSGLP